MVETVEGDIHVYSLPAMKAAGLREVPAADRPADISEMERNHILGVNGYLRDVVKGVRNAAGPGSAVATDAPNGVFEVTGPPDAQDRVHRYLDWQNRLFTTRLTIIVGVNYVVLDTPEQVAAERARVTPLLRISDIARRIEFVASGGGPRDVAEYLGGNGRTFVAMGTGGVSTNERVIHTHVPVCDPDHLVMSAGQTITYSDLEGSPSCFNATATITPQFDADGSLWLFFHVDRTAGHIFAADGYDWWTRAKVGSSVDTTKNLSRALDPDTAGGHKPAFAIVEMAVMSLPDPAVLQQ